MRKYEINYKQFCGECGHKLLNFPDLTSVGANSIITHTFPSQQTLASSCQVPHSSLLVSITLFLPPCSFYQKSCICHFLSHLAFYVTSNQYIKTLLQLLLPYSNFLHFCKSGSVLSPPSCYPVFCATFFPHLLYSFMQVIPFHSFYAAVWWPALHHSKSLSWGCGSKPGPLRAGTAGHFK